MCGNGCIANDTAYRIRHLLTGGVCHGGSGSVFLFPGYAHTLLVV